MKKIFSKGFQFVYHENKATILDSLIEDGIGSSLHFECKEGHCGSCRLSLVSGEVEYTKPPLAFLRDGEVLVCISRPKTDIVLK